VNRSKENPILVDLSIDFGVALSALKAGHKAYREGWNGKGMFIYLVRERLVRHKDFVNEAAEAVKLAYKLEGNVDNAPSDRIVNAHIDMKDNWGHITVGWNPSQVDMLAEDWIIVD
jgi:hypothetical protein